MKIKIVRIRSLVLFGLVFLTIWVPIMGLAQDYDTGLHDEESWTSPIFETTKDTRIEWEVHLYTGRSDYSFVIKVVRDTGEVWDTKSGGNREDDIVKSTGSIDFAMKCYLEITARNVRVWVVKLFTLASPPITTTSPDTTTTTPLPTTTVPPTTTAPTTVTVAEVTVTNTVTVINRDPVTTTVTVAETTYTRLAAAFTELPEGTRLVTPTLMGWLTGFLFAVLSAIIFALFLFRKKGGIIVYAKEDTENVSPGPERTISSPSIAESENPDKPHTDL